MFASAKEAAPIFSSRSLHRHQADSAANRDTLATAARTSTTTATATVTAQYCSGTDDFRESLTNRVPATSPVAVAAAAAEAEAEAEAEAAAAIAAEVDAKARA